MGLRPGAKLVGDLDGSYRMQYVMAPAARAACPGCRRMFEADTPFIDGTSFGPVALGIMLFLFEIGATDRDVADFFRTVFGFVMSDNAVWNARRAVSAHLRRFQIGFIKLAFLLWQWVNMDETKFKRGDGHYGYVWPACTPGCVFVWFSPTRSAAVLEGHLGRLRDRYAVCDGYAAYLPFFAAIRMCRGHMLAASEKPAVRNRETDEAVYDMLPEFYRETKRIRTLAPLTCMDLSRRAYAIAVQHRDGDVRTYLPNALPRAFTFLAHPGMPPHNNDAERELRDAVIPQRNRRHKLVTAEGREVFSTLVKFARTCRKQGVSSSRALLESILDRAGWDVTRNAGDVPYSLANPDGSRYSVFDEEAMPMPAPPTPALPPPIQVLPLTYQSLPSQRQPYSRTSQLPPHPVKPPPEIMIGTARQARTAVAYGVFS